MRVMNLIFMFLSVVAVLQSIDAGISTTFWKLEEHFLNHKLKRMKTLPVPVLSPKVETHYLLQDLDQFDSENTDQFYQRYYINSANWDKATGPVFLLIGGESQLSPHFLMAGEMVELARKYGALLFGVEHRYYGKSVPVKGLKVENIHFLSSQQALADLADFHEHAVQKYKLTSSNRWIAFGGSYPGALSAWLRTKFPHVVYGAVASSAPILAKMDFQEYNEVVANSLSSSLVGGSQLCRNSVKEAFEEIDKLIVQKQFNKLQFDFASCNDISHPNDTTQFASNLAGIFMGIVQYNNEIQEALNIRRVCSYMTNTNKTAYERLIDVNKAYLKHTYQKCTDNSYANSLKMLSNDTTDPSGSRMYRQWIYQTCSQFGYYQTCDKGTSCVFSNQITLDTYVDMCQVLFNISPVEVSKRVSFTNAYYGGRRPRGTRIIFLNGSIDPWHALSIIKNQTSTSELAIYIPGTAHCANMEPSNPSDPLPLKMARTKTSEIIGEWLKEPIEGKDVYF